MVNEATIEAYKAMAKGYPANMPVTLGVCPPSVAEYMEMFRRERKNAVAQG